MVDDAGRQGEGCGTITGDLGTFLVHTVLSGWQGVLVLVSLLLIVAQERRPPHGRRLQGQHGVQGERRLAGPPDRLRRGSAPGGEGGNDPLAAVMAHLGAMAVAQRQELQTAQSLCRQLVALREAMPAVADELGTNPTSHASFRPFQLLHGAQVDVLRVVASRLMLCGQDLRSLKQAEQRRRDLGEAPR
ncbi:hypothetical protein [Synechococcus sp. BA-132 BA5]|uniref:hypothetical protein n=1 Tax=Synechococcus sp. BA-132 BA5 TaxID=3110252 RepID=UPI002B2056F5|nr:hypothetical protein [Synechococcus sp. BA-132 BA5]MEA5414397.1 hypothetical protein [Synechococcus sp. BA-132 BA5]